MADNVAADEMTVEKMMMMHQDETGQDDVLVVSALVPSI